MGTVKMERTGTLEHIRKHYLKRINYVLGVKGNLI
jgi:hypothetical protein